MPFEVIAKDPANNSILSILPVTVYDVQPETNSEHLRFLIHYHDKWQYVNADMFRPFEEQAIPKSLDPWDEDNQIYRDDMPH